MSAVFSNYSERELDLIMEDDQVKARIEKAIEEKLEGLISASSANKPQFLSSNSNASANLISDLQTLLDSVVEAREIIPEYEAVYYQNEDPSTAKFQRVAVSALKRGFIIPVFITSPSATLGDPEETVSGFSAFYTVVSISNGTVEIVLIADYQKDISGKSLAKRATFTRIEDNRSVLVLSSCTIESQFLPASVLSAMGDVSILPSSPPDGCDRLGASSSTQSSGLSSTSVKALVREASLAPLRRALHNDQSLLSNIVGPLQDLSSKVVLNNLRNLQSSTRLNNLPFWDMTEHLEAFLGFRWSDQPYINGSKKCYDGMHLSLFLARDKYKNYARFNTCVDIITALDNLEFACKVLFQEKADRPFYQRIFRSLRDLLSSMDIIESVQSLPIDFVVWKLSKILVQWALLYTDDSKALANSTFVAFYEANVQALNFSAADFQAENARVDVRFLPRQGNNIVNGGFGDLTTSSAPQQASKVTSRKRKTAPVAFPPGTPISRSPTVLAGSTSKSASPVPVKGKYICLGDLLHKVEPADYPACKKPAEECNQRHIVKPSALQPKDREELLTSIARLQGIANSRKAQMCASVNAMP